MKLVVGALKKAKKALFATEAIIFREISNKFELDRMKNVNQKVD